MKFYSGNVKLVKLLLVLSILVIGIDKTHGVDTDPTAYSVPYLMVDPQTGQLVEVDPSNTSITDAGNPVNNSVTTPQNLEIVNIGEQSSGIYYLAAVFISLIIIYFWAVKNQRHQKTSG